MNLIQKSRTCARLGCTCSPRLGSKYCGEWCEKNPTRRKATCGCGHNGCGTIGVLTDEGSLMPESA